MAAAAAPAREVGDRGIPSMPGLDHHDPFSDIGVILAGNTGVGKSLLCNIIYGGEVFEHRISAGCVTDGVQSILGQYIDPSTNQQVAYKIFNIPGLIESNINNIARNKKCLKEACESVGKQIFIYVFDVGTAGRAKADDIAAFKSVQEAYQLQHQSYFFLFNRKPIRAEENYEGEFLLRLKQDLQWPNLPLNYMFIEEFTRDQFQRTIDPTTNKLKWILNLNHPNIQALRDNLWSALLDATAAHHSEVKPLQLGPEVLKEAEERLKENDRKWREKEEEYKKAEAARQ